MTLDQAFEQARTLESAEVHAASYMGSSFPVQSAAMKTEDFSEETVATSAASSSSRSQKCFFCGNDLHSRTLCPARDVTCRNCGKKGHYQRVCKSRQAEIENEPSVLKLDTKEVDCQTDLTFEEINEMEKKLHALDTNFVNITHKHSQNEIFNNAKAFNFYTKIQNVAFFTALLNLVLSGWKPLTNTSLEYSEQLLLVFMKLRLGLLHEDFAFRFKISKSAASSIFKEWVRRLAEVLKKHIRVPSKQQYRRRVPAKFLKENWSRVTALIDCSEIFIDRAFNLDARALTFSQYKSHNTVKFLIACTPLGKVSFVSKLFGGRTSDKQIIQLSGFWNKFDLVM
ncbi:putative isl2eu-2 adi [Trichonephila clavipes]|nr:putative isl2eu-2 adi [Trichonephila clavipes]